MKSSSKVIRQTKDGDFTPCSAAEENVGKRRCNHVPNSTSFKVQVNKLNRNTQEIIVSDEYDELDKRDKKAVISKFISDLEPINKKELNNILEQIRDY